MSRHHHLNPCRPRPGKRLRIYAASARPTLPLVSMLARGFIQVSRAVRSDSVGKTPSTPPPSGDVLLCWRVTLQLKTPFVARRIRESQSPGWIFVRRTRGAEEEGAKMSYPLRGPEAKYLLQRAVIQMSQNSEGSDRDLRHLREIGSSQEDIETGLHMATI